MDVEDAVTIEAIVVSAVMADLVAVAADADVAVDLIHVIYAILVIHAHQHIILILVAAAEIAKKENTKNTKKNMFAAMLHKLSNLIVDVVDSDQATVDLVDLDQIAEADLAYGG